jgi:hypothetical protein
MVCCHKVNLEVIPSLVWCNSFIPTLTCTMEVSCGEDPGVHSAEFLCFTNHNSSQLCVIYAILDLLEQSFNRLPGIPCIAHVLKVVFQFHCSDAAIRHKEVFKHFSRIGVSKSNHVIVQIFKIHRFKYRYDLLFESLLHSGSSS